MISTSVKPAPSRVRSTLACSGSAPAI
jgi:hypothetical protein